MDPFKPHGIAALNNPDPKSLKYFSNVSAQNIPYGKTFEVTFDKVGRFDYTTIFQPQTTGTVIVTK
jgi:plastocyanin